MHRLQKSSHKKCRLQIRDLLGVYEKLMFPFRTNFSHFERSVSSFGNVNKVVLPSVLLQLLTQYTRSMPAICEPCPLRTTLAQVIGSVNVKVTKNVKDEDIEVGVSLTEPVWFKLR